MSERCTGSADEGQRRTKLGAELTELPGLRILEEMARPFSTLAELFEHSVADFPAAELFGEKNADGTWSWIHYRDFGQLVERARGGLRQRGVGRGDRVALISDNRVPWAVTAFATYTLGAVVVPMYEAQHPEEWEYILRDSGAKLVVAGTPRIHQIVSGLVELIDGLEVAVGVGLPDHDPGSYGALLSAGEEHPAPAEKVEPSELAGIIYTSGTTGNPKGVMLSHGNFSSNVMGAFERFTFEPSDVSLAFLPWAHSFGQTAELYSMMHQGAAMAINDEVPQLINNLPVVRPSVLVAVPRIFNRIYDGVNKQMVDKALPIRALFRSALAAARKQQEGLSLGWSERLSLGLADRLIFEKIRAKFGGRLRFVVSGSAALSPEVARFIDALGIDVYEGYGLTETSPVVSANYPGHRKIGSIGLPFPNVEVSIDVSVTDDPRSGEILVKGPNVMQGYYNQPEETAKVVQEGVFRTGDMGYVDDDGFLYITGRIKEQYKLENGKYVVPSALEEQLKLSPLITNIMLHGANKPHNVAVVVPDIPALQAKAEEHGWTVSVDALTTDPRVSELLMREIGRFSDTFKGYERPKRLLVTPDDFTTENGQLTPSLKVKRRVVLERYGTQLEALFET